MNKQELIKKITEKKEFSQLPKKDVEMVFEKFNKEHYVDSEKVKMTRDLLRKIYSVFASQKLLKLKDKDPEWILGKHLSTKERLPYYKEVYERIFKNVKEEKLTVFDLGAGINGFSYNYFPKGIDYVGVEAMKQLVDLMNYYFKTRGLNAWSIHESLFELDKIKKYLKQDKNYKVVFLFKVLDSLEMIESDYSKKLLWDIVPLCNKVIVSFATRSLVRKTKFKVSRGWILKFISENFNVLDDFEIGTERYIIFSKK
jgi:2-polyprenyl-3-methyl-5-hydroxy-6-metoxy-1,4-benzoquinol methylase